MSKGFTPRDYQERAIGFVIEHPRCALWMEMGLGKTVVLLSAITDLLVSRDIHRVLVISTLRVAQNVWAQEAAKWQHTAGLVVHQVLGSAKQREAALRRSGHIWVTNVENLRWLVERCDKRWPFDMVVFDESSLFKAHNAKTRFRSARRITPACKRVVQLTGTPAPNGLLGLWSQLYLLDQGARLGKTFGGYRERWFDSDYMGYRWTPKAFADAQIHAKVADICLSLQAKDYLELGETVRNYIPVELPPQARDIYDQMEKEFFIELASGRVEAENAAVKSGRLLQLANGASYLDEDGRWEGVHHAKLDALEEVIEEAAGNPVLVAYQFRFDLAMLQHRFPQARVLDKDPATVEDWNAGRIPLLLAHPACLCGDTEVLTEMRGWKRITEVSRDERVFDGVEFVAHGGCSYSGYKNVIRVFGIGMTPEHRLLVSGKWEKANDVRTREGARREASYKYTGNDQAISQMFALRNDRRNAGAELHKTQPGRKEVLRALYRRNFSSHVENQDIPNLERHTLKMRRSSNERLQELRRAWCTSVRTLAEVRELLRRYARRLRGRSADRTNRRERRLLERELPLGDQLRAASKQAQQSGFGIQGRIASPSRAMPQNECRQDEDTISACQRYDARGSRWWSGKEHKEIAHVYDLIDCGPRSRFLIRNAAGEVFVSHNSAGHGLSLQDGGNICVWYGLTWSLEQYLQFNERLGSIRQAQSGYQRPVFIHHLVAQNTIDEVVLDALQNKKSVLDALLQAVKHEDRVPAAG